MGYFEGLAGGAFKKGADGRTLYYPWGVFGKGRVLPDEAAERRVRKFLIGYYAISLPALVLLGVWVSGRWAMVVGAVSVVGFCIVNKALVGHLPTSGERLRVKEAYRNSAAMHSASTLWLLLVACAVLGLLSAVMMVTARSPAGWQAALLGLAVAVPAAGVIAYMLRAKREIARGEGAPPPWPGDGQASTRGAATHRVRVGAVVRVVVLSVIALAALLASTYAYVNRDRLFPAKDTVVVYGRERCGITRMVRDGLQAQGIPYVFADADIPAIDDELWYKLGPRFKAQRITFPVVHVGGRLLLTPTADQVAQALVEHRASAAQDKSARDYGTLLQGADPAPQHD